MSKDPTDSDNLPDNLGYLAWYNSYLGTYVMRHCLSQSRDGWMDGCIRAGTQASTKQPEQQQQQSVLWDDVSTYLPCVSDLLNM